MKSVKVAIGIVVLIIAIVGVSVLINHFVSSENQSLIGEYNGYNFAKLDNGIWTVALPDHVDQSGKPFVLNVHHTPDELLNVGVGKNLTNFFPSNETYLSYDPADWAGNSDLKIALMDLSLKLAGTAAFFQKNTLLNPKVVCSKNNDKICNEIGVYNCEANPDKKIISFVQAKSDNVYLNGNCLVIEASKGDFLNVTDRLLFSWFNIMEP